MSSFGLVFGGEWSGSVDADDTVVTEAANGSVEGCAGSGNCAEGVTVDDAKEADDNETDGGSLTSSSEFGLDERD